MPSVMGAVDVPTALFNEAVLLAPRGDMPLKPVRYDSNNGRHFSASRGREAAVTANMEFSHLTKYERVVGPRHLHVSGGGNAEAISGTCVAVQGLDRGELANFYNRQLTTLPCVHNLTAKSKHGGGNSAVANARMLQLSQNNITSLFETEAPLQNEQPIVLTTFSRVVVLDVSRNKLTSLAGVQMMTSLRVLHASHNKLEDIDPLFAPNSILRQSGTLRVLDVSFNHIRALPSINVETADRSLRGLRTLILSCNHLKDLDDLSVLFPSLLKLCVARNQLTAAPLVLPKRIRCLNLRHNYLDKVAVRKLCELQRGKLYPLEVDVSEQRTGQLDALRNDNDDATDYVVNYGVAAEEDIVKATCFDDGNDSSAAAVASETVGLTTALATTENLVKKGARAQQQMQKKKKEKRWVLIKLPFTQRTVRHGTSFLLSTVVFKKGCSWLEHNCPNAMVALIYLFMAATLRPSGRVSERYFFPLHTEFISIRTFRLKCKRLHAETLTPRVGISVIDLNRLDKSYGCKACVKACVLGRPSSLKLQMRTDRQARREDVDNNNIDVGQKELKDEKVAPQQYKQSHHSEDMIISCTTLPRPCASKRHPLKCLVFSRDWLVDELKAPLKWTPTKQSRTVRSYDVLCGSTRKPITTRYKCSDLCVPSQSGK